MRSLVFVHGYLGGSKQWAEQVATFSPFFDVITPDLPGYGCNRALPAPDTIGDFADYVLEQVRDRGVERFDLVGHSMGGMIVQEMVARAPERVARLVLYGTGPVGLLPGRFETIAESKRRVVADGGRRPKSVDRPRIEQMLAADLIEHFLRIFKQFFRLRSHLWMVHDFRIGSFKPPASKEEAPIDPGDQFVKRQVLDDASSRK